MEVNETSPKHTAGQGRTGLTNNRIKELVGSRQNQYQFSDGPVVGSLARLDSDHADESVFARVHCNDSG